MNIVRRYPIVAVVGLIAALYVGVAIGRRSSIPLPRSLTASIGDHGPELGPKLDQRLDPSHAELVDGELVQSLSDGTRVVFTLNPPLQSWTTKLLRDYQVPYGAVVAYDIDSGETLLLSGYSHRSPDISAQELCLTPWAPAASVFKLVSASALLSLGIPESTAVCYHGGLSGLSAAHLRSNPHLDRTCDTLHAAVARSINAVIAKLASRHTRPDQLEAWAERFGFNQPIPFELPVEPSRATIPTQALEFARAAAGFWHTDISALHGAVIASVAINDGHLRWPHVVRRIERPGRQPKTPPRPSSRRILSPPVARALAEMMDDTVRIGTASRAFHATRGSTLPSSIRTGGKTGSLARQDPFLSYSWFVGYAARDGGRRAAIGVLLGNPPRWRVKAATVARQVLARMFERSANGPARSLAAAVPGS